MNNGILEVRVAHLLMSEVSVGLAWRRLWMLPYTCEFDSVRNGSAAKVMIPHGHMPAKILVLQWPWF